MGGAQKVVLTIKHRQIQVQGNTVVRILKMSYRHNVRVEEYTGINLNYFLLLHTTKPTKMTTEVEDNLICKSEIWALTLPLVYWAGRSGDRIPVEAGFSVSVRTGPVVHPASHTMVPGLFPGGKRPGRGVNHFPYLAIPVLPLWALMACSRAHFTSSLPCTISWVTRELQKVFTWLRNILLF